MCGLRGACSYRVHIGCRSRSSGVPASAASLLAGRRDRAIARPIIRSRRPSRGGSTWTSRMALLDRDERLRHGGLIGYVLELLTGRCPELEHQERASLPAARTAARHVRYDLLPASPTLPSCSANRNRKRIARPHGVHDSAQRAPLKRKEPLAQPPNDDHNHLDPARPDTIRNSPGAREVPASRHQPDRDHAGRAERGRSARLPFRRHPGRRDRLRRPRSGRHHCARPRRPPFPATSCSRQTGAERCSAR